MYYQGENIRINITSDSVTDLKNQDFKLLVYPHFERNNAIYLVDMAKSSATQTEDEKDKTTFSFNIPYNKTKSLPIGDYDIEILVKNSDDTFRSIFQKTFAFQIGFANSKKQ